jgi:signal transduction histidine kinase
MAAPDKTISVVAYETAVRACISNVLRNAVLHGTSAGQVQVDVAREADDAVITIQDDGGGVAEKDLQRLFEPFFRVQKSSSDSGSQGTGLGLAIASRAAARNGGSITASNRNGGLAVIIRLPAELT